MRKQLICGAFVLGILICLSGAPAQAQSKIDIFGGYSFQDNSFNDDDPGLHGANVSVTYNLNRHVGMEANFATHDGTNIVYTENEPVMNPTFTEVDTQKSDIFTAMFGPKLTEPIGKFDLYTHFLVGVAHSHNNDSFVDTTDGTVSDTGFDETKGTGFGMELGGGVDWNHGRWGVRILEADYVHASTSGPFTCGTCNYTETFENTQDDFQLSTGIIFHWGMK